MTTCIDGGWAIIDPAKLIPTTGDDLPDEMLWGIFQFLSEVQLYKCAYVNRRWRSIVLHPSLLEPTLFLKLRYPGLTIISETVWKKYVKLENYSIDFDDAVPIDWLGLDPTLLRFFKHVEPFRKRYFTKYPKKNPGIADNAGMTILTIPRGLTPTIMWQMGIDLCKRSDGSYPDPQMVVGNKNTYTVLIANNVFNHTSWMGRAESARFLKRLGMELPTTLTLYCLIVMRRIIQAATDEKIWCTRETKKIYVSSDDKQGNTSLVISNHYAMIPVYISHNQCSWANYGPIGMVKLT